MIFSLISIIILFKFLCTTVEEYIAPGIVYITKKLNMSDALAGVTLLAFANGACDVITAFVASDSPDGISYNIGALYGAGFFVLTLVIACTILFSPVSITVYKSVIYRDIGFYIIAAVYTLFAGIYGKINLSIGCGFLGIYALYVIVVII